MNIFIVLFLALIVSCSAGTISKPENLRTPSRQKQFNVLVEEAISLADTMLSIAHVKGGFIGCVDHDWTIDGASGTVNASAECTSISYKSLVVRLDDVDFTLRINSDDQVSDSEGNTWKFTQSSADANPKLVASFSKNSTATVTIEKKRIGVGVSVDPGDGAVCDGSNPFQVLTDSYNVVISVNAPKGGFPTGALLKLLTPPSAVLPKVELDQTNLKFEIDFTGTTAGVYTYEGFQIESVDGRSDCTITKLIVNLIEAPIIPFVPSLDVTGDGVVTGSTDGVIIRRFVDGQDIRAVSERLIGLSATRKTDAAIIEYLIALRPYLDIDGDGALSEATDGTLIFRYLIGKRGNDLVTGAVNSAGTRTSAADIEPYLASIVGGVVGSWDIDGDGAMSALTDGILINRYMLGKRGADLINGCIGTSATRKTADQIETYLRLMSSVLDIDGNGSLNSSTDGQLIFRYMFDPAGSFGVDDVVDPLGARVTPQAVRDYMNGIALH